MKRFMYVAGLVALTGCGLSEDKYAEESIRLSCEFIMECYADLELYASVDECITEVTADSEDPPDTCEYDAKAAKDCLSALEDMECPAEGELPETPAACEDVYVCEDTNAAE